MLRCYFRLNILDKDKNLIKKGRAYKTKSFVKQFLQLWYRDIIVTSFTVKDTSGTNQLDASGNNLYHSPMTGGESNDFTITDTNDYFVGGNETGIVIGTGTNAVTPSDYQLQTIIADGDSSSQMKYYGGRYDNYTVDTGTDESSFDVSRLFKNDSGGSITINEIGFYCLDLDKKYCIIRDKLTSGVAVSDTEYLEVTYTFKIVV